MTIDPLQGLVKIAVRHGPLWSARLGTSFGTYPSGNRMWDRSVACSDLAMTTNEHTAGVSVSPVEDVPPCGTALVLESRWRPALIGTATTVGVDVQK